MKQLQPSSTKRSFPPISPQKQQWSLINKFKAIEFERMCEIERQVNKKKKQTFKRQLDDQINNKSNIQLMHKMEDKKYYDMLAMQSQEQRVKEERLMQEKVSRRRQLEEENWQNKQMTKLSNSRGSDREYYFQIGVKSENEQKEKVQKSKREMMDALDIQVRQKSQEAIRNKLTNLHLQQLAVNFNKNQYERKQKKVYAQNQKVYEKYEVIDKQKRVHNKMLEMKFVDEAMEKKMKEEEDRHRINQNKRSLDTIRVKETLDQQIRLLNNKRQLQLVINPEQNNFSFISNIFKPRTCPYDRLKYSKYLHGQAQQQRLRRLKEHHMTVEEYKFNLNQLQQAVSGNYVHKGYIDPPLGAIGDDKKYGTIQERLHDKDEDIVKQRVERLKNRGAVNAIINHY